MLMTEWSRKMASAKWTYTAVLTTVFLILNLLVHLTLHQIGRISFSYLIFGFLFQDTLRSLTNLSYVLSFQVGAVSFCIFAVALFRGILGLFGTKVQIMGWILLVVTFISALPIFDSRNIFI